MQTHIIARSLVFNEDGMLLLLVRSNEDDYRPGGHDFPGGQIDEGEELVAGALRELREETGLELEPHDMQLVCADAACGFNTTAQAEINMVKLIFATKIVSPHVVLSDEHQAHDWVNIEAAIERMRAEDYTSGAIALEYLMDNNIVRDLWSRQ